MGKKMSFWKWLAKWLPITLKRVMISNIMEFIIGMIGFSFSIPLGLIGLFTQVEKGQPLRWFLFLVIPFFLLLAHSHYREEMEDC